MASKGEQVNVYHLEPAKSISQAVNAARAHVNAVNSQAGNATTSGAGATIVHGKSQGQGNN